MTMAQTKDDPGGDLKLQSLTKTFGDFVAVDDLDLTIPQGSFFALLGPSGCGKTTTLRMVAGLERPTAGTIMIGDQDVTEARPYQRPVNTVFQSYALFPHLNIVENVEFGLRRRNKKNTRATAMEALELVQLAHLALRKPGQLSGGQQQRIALARAIVNRPSVLLLDEPLGALDLKLRRQMQIELKRIQLEVGLTFVHVTHDQEEAMTMADTIAVMNARRDRAARRPGDPVRAPEHHLRGELPRPVEPVARQGVRLRRRRPGDRRPGRAAARCPRTAARRPRGDVWFGVRPEKLVICDASTAPSAGNRISGTVTDASFTGVSTQYLVKLAVGAGDHRRPAERRHAAAAARRRGHACSGRRSTGSRWTRRRTRTPARSARAGDAVLAGTSS